MGGWVVFFLFLFLVVGGVRPAGWFICVACGLVVVVCVVRYDS